jgi:hypothetical protein
VHLRCGCWYNHGVVQGSGEGHVWGLEESGMETMGYEME